MHRFILEKYRGNRTRFTCPSCGRASEFVRYVDRETGAHLADDVGKCNRETSCGYHLRPREHFAANPDFAVIDNTIMTRRAPVRIPAKPPDFIAGQILKQTLDNYQHNAFVSFLLSRFDSRHVADAVKRFLVGTWTDGRTVFWQIDTKRRVRTGKLIAYDAQNGKRITHIAPNWVHAELKRSKVLCCDFALKQCLFGEHLLTAKPETIAIVEAEKTAIIASLHFPAFVWLASGGCGNLNLDRLRKCAGRKIVLFPDSSKFAQWQKIADEARTNINLDVRVSDLLETSLTDEEKRQDLDLADVLLNARNTETQMTDEMIEYSAHLEYYGASREDADQTARREFA